MGDLTIKFCFVILCAALVLQLYTLISSGFQDIMEAPSRFSRWLTTDNAFGYTTWSWRYLSQKLEDRDFSGSFDIAKLTKLRDAFLYLCIAVAANILVAIWCIAAFLLGLVAKSQYNFKRQDRWSWILGFSVLFSWLCSTAQLIIYFVVINEALDYNISFHHLGACLYLWCISSGLLLINVPMAFVSLRRSGKKLKQKIRKAQNKSRFA